MGSIRKIRKKYKRKFGIKQICIHFKFKDPKFRLSRSLHKDLRRYLTERMRKSLLSGHVYR
jgi:hypothetical protein